MTKKTNKKNHFEKKRHSRGIVARQKNVYIYPDIHDLQYMKTKGGTSPKTVMFDVLPLPLL